MKRTVNIWKSLDWLTVFLFLLIVIIGWLNIYAAVFSEEHRSIFDFDMRYGKQLFWIMIALLIAIVVMFIDTRFYSFFAYIIYIINILILILVLFVGIKIKGARSWFEFFGVYFQPSEFAKAATCLALAKYLSTYSVRIEKFKTILIAFIIIFTPAFFIIFQPDYGSVIIYFAFIFVLYREGFSGWFIFFGFLLVALFVLALIFNKLPILIILTIIALLSITLLTKRYKDAIFISLAIILSYCIIIWLSSSFHTNINKYIALLFSLGVVSLASAIIAFANKIPRIIILVVIFFWVAFGFTYSVNYVFEHFLEPHQQKRVNILLGKESDPAGAAYNIEQSKIAIGSGGFFGKGFLQGTQTKFNFVPEQSTDFIFCTVGEEWGFTGVFLVLIFFLALLLRLIYLAERQRSVFSRIYGYGLVSVLFFHIAVNIGMTIGLMPVIGIPLPFFSYGGSALWSFTIMLFIFLRFDASRMELLR